MTKKEFDWFCSFVWHASSGSCPECRAQLPKLLGEMFPEIAKALIRQVRAEREKESDGEDMIKGGEVKTVRNLWWDGHRD